MDNARVAINTALGVIGATLINLLGGWYVPLQTLIGFMEANYTIGIGLLNYLTARGKAGLTDTAFRLMRRNSSNGRNYDSAYRDSLVICRRHVYAEV